MRRLSRNLEMLFLSFTIFSFEDSSPNAIDLTSFYSATGAQQHDQPTRKELPA